MGGMAFSAKEEAVILDAALADARGWSYSVAKELNRSQGGVLRKGKELLAKRGGASPAPQSQSSVWRIVLQDDRRISVTAANFSAALDMLNPSLHGDIKNVISVGE